MICRRFYLTVESAVDVPNVRKVFATRAYAKVEIGSADDGMKKLKFSLNPDNRNGLNPVWYQSMACNISDSGLLHYGVTVVIKLYTERSFGNRYIGEVPIRMKDLFDNGCGGKRSLPIMQGGQETGGILHFSYGFGERFEMPESHFTKSSSTKIIFNIIEGITYAIPHILVAVFM